MVPHSLRHSLRPPKALLRVFSAMLFMQSLWCLADEHSKQTTDPDNQWLSSTVQVLAYKGNSLLNQGSGVIVAEGGVVVTAAHLLEKADSITVKGSAGLEHAALIVKKNQSSDLAVLRVGAMTHPSIVFTLGALSENDRLTIAGYWHLSAEKPRKSFFGLSSKPGFVAEIVPDVQVTRALPGEQEADAEVIKLVTSVGRGAYGAPLVNRCGQLVGLIRPKLGKTLKELWQSHTPLGAVAMKVSVIEEELEALSISPVKADEPCLSVADQQQAAQTEKQEEINKAKEQIKRAEEAAKEATENAEKEKQAREDAEEGQKEISTIVTEINRKAESIDFENIEIKQENQTLVWAVVAAVVGGLLLAIILVRKRRKDLSKANQALKSASASFGDCRFEGRDSSGSPIAFFVLGKDLMQRESGLILGRNPDVAQVVIADDTVSRQHAQLFVKDEHLYIKDLGSTGGTRVNGVAISDEGAALISGDQVEFGRASVEFSIREL
jgi:hypothetical protein